MYGLDLHIAVGVLKGYDQLMNLVLDNVEEHLRSDFPYRFAG